MESFSCRDRSRSTHC